MEREKLIRLVTAAQSGDGDSLNALFSEFYNDVYYFALKTVKDEDLAGDITQESFVEIINTIGDLKEPAAFVKWMKQITYHQCTRYFKKKKDVLVDEDEEGNTVFDIVAEERAEFIPDEALDQKDFRKTILAMLDELSEEQRAATLLYYYDELSVKQIAEIQGVSEGTVKSRLNYARKSIKNSVETYEKKNNVKLHSFAFLPFMFWLLKAAAEESAGAAAAAAPGVAAGVSAATGAAISLGGTTAAAASGAAGVAAAGASTAAAVATTAAASTTAATTSAAAAGTGILAKVAALPLAAKIVSAIAAVAIVAGGVGMAVSGQKNEPTVPTTSGEQFSGSTAPTVTVPVTEPVVSTAPDTPTAPETTQPNTVLYYVPQDAEYITADGERFVSGQKITTPALEGDQLVTSDYTYTCFATDSGQIGWSVKVNDTSDTIYEDLIAEVNGLPLLSLQNAYLSCTNMLQAPEIPDTVTNVDCAYYECTNLKQAPKLPLNVTSLYATFYNCQSLIEAPVIYELSVTDMSYAFEGCSKLTYAPKVPSTAVDLTQTFARCTGLLQAPEIPERVAIMKSTFYGCTSLTTASTIPASVTDMDYCFFGCTALTGIIEINGSPVSPRQTFWDTALPIWVTGKCDNGTLLVLAWTDSKGNVNVLPDDYAPEPPEGHAVPAGCTYIMKDGTILTEGQMMPEVPEQGDELVSEDYTYKYGYYFWQMDSMLGHQEDWRSTNLETWGVRVNDKTQTEYAPLFADICGKSLDLQCAFYNCTKMVEAPQIPTDVTNLWRTFDGCLSLTVAPRIPDGVTSMVRTFSRCSSLESPSNIPEGVINVEGIFENCVLLRTAPYIPDSVQNMQKAFYECRLLVLPPNIPYGVYDISFAFYNCASLIEKPDIPDTVTDMQYAFYGCDSLPDD